MRKTEGKNTKAAGEGLSSRIGRMFSGVLRRTLIFVCLVAAVALQLLAYYVSSDKGFDVDKPRNLAKVVTVE